MGRVCFVCGGGPPLKYVYRDFTHLGIRREFGFLLCPAHQDDDASIQEAWEKGHGSTGSHRRERRRNLPDRD